MAMLLILLMALFPVQSASTSRHEAAAVPLLLLDAGPLDTSALIAVAAVAAVTVDAATMLEFAVAAALEEREAYAGVSSAADTVLKPRGPTHAFDSLHAKRWPPAGLEVRPFPGARAAVVAMSFTRRRELLS